MTIIAILTAAVIWIAAILVALQIVAINRGVLQERRLDHNTRAAVREMLGAHHRGAATQEQIIRCMQQRGVPSTVCARILKSIGDQK